MRDDPAMSSAAEPGCALCRIQAMQLVLDCYPKPQSFTEPGALLFD